MARAAMVFESDDEDIFTEPPSPKRPLSESFDQELLGAADSSDLDKELDKNPDKASDKAPDKALDKEREEFADLLASMPFKAEDKHRQDSRALSLPRDKKARSSSKRLKAQPLEIDLHGKTLKEALWFVQQTIDSRLNGYGYVYARVITGRGRHSKGEGPVLAEKVYDFVKHHYSGEMVSLEDSPAHSVVNGMSVRGHFHVELRRKRA